MPSKLEKLFKEIDKSEKINRLTCLGFPAWPLVKERLWLNLTKPSARNKKFIKNKFGKIVVNCCKGVCELFMCFVFTKPKRYVFGINSKTFRFADKVNFHPHLGTILQDYADQSFILHYGYRGNLKITPSSIHDSYLGSLLYVFSHILCRTPLYNELANKLSDKLQENGLRICKKNVRELIKLALSTFCIKYFFYKFFFRKIKPRKLFIQDPNGKPGEVLAAKSCNIKIIEIQHGVFSANDIDYAWTVQHRKIKSFLPVPDSILVFGELWRELILQNGFYHQNEVSVIKCEIINFYRSQIRPKRKNYISVLFPTQNSVTDNEIKFWDNFLMMAKFSKGQEINLWIKVHPNDSLSKYNKLSEKHPLCCKIYSACDDPYLLISRCDYVVGYTSTMLLEGLALSKPAVSLEGKISKHNIWQEDDLGFIKENISFITTPRDLLIFLRRSPYDDLVLKTQLISEKLYGSESPSFRTLLT